jgi:hypothetical protein
MIVRIVESVVIRKGVVINVTPSAAATASSAVR